MLYPARFFSSVFKLEMPALSPTMTDGNIVSWSKKEGDLVKVGDIVCEIQTDKATIGFESQEEGYLAKILVPKDSKNVEIGKLIGLLVEEKKDIASIDLSKYTSSPAKVDKKVNPEPSKSQAEITLSTPSTKSNGDFSNEYHI